MQPERFTSFAPQELAAALEPVRTHHAFQNHVTNFTQRIEDNRGAPVVFEALGTRQEGSGLYHSTSDHLLPVTRLRSLASLAGAKLCYNKRGIDAILDLTPFSICSSWPY